MSCSMVFFSVGKGTNACYVENLDKVETWDGDREEPREVSLTELWT